MTLGGRMSLRRQLTLQRLPVMHTAIDHLEAKRLVNLLRQGVINLGIRGHFQAPVAASPFFRGRQELFAHALFSVTFRDEPAFYKAHGPAGITAVGMGS